MNSIAIFGGAFDPVHYGHIKTSLSVQSHYHFDVYFFVPCKIPTIKATSLASCQQRLDMLNLAIKEYPQFKIDTREIDRSSPSYMVETLSSFREEYKRSSITLIIGYDAFLSLPKWYEWDKLLSLANLLVINRNQYAKSQLPLQLEQLLQKHEQDDRKKITDITSGIIQFYNAGDYDISSTEIRQEIAKSSNQAAMAIPAEVYDYIKKQELYR
jgi:nicotinate-nucleotide adenylyltransferase